MLIFYNISISYWGCIPDSISVCQDITNALSTLIGVIIGIIISWWIYNRQINTTRKQDELLNKISNLEDMHYKILKKIESIDKRNEQLLLTIIEHQKKIKNGENNDTDNSNQ